MRPLGMRPSAVTEIDEAAGGADRVAADERDAVALLVGLQAAGKGGKPALGPVLGQGQREKIAEGRRALGGEIGEIDAQRLPGDRGRRVFREEMNVRREHVGGDDQVLARPLAIDRCVVGERQRAGIAGQRPEIAFDQFELAGTLLPLRRHRA